MTSRGLLTMVLLSGALSQWASAQAPASTQVGASAGPVRNDLPQPYRTTRNWGELPPGVKWAAVTAVEPAPNGIIYVIHRCFANSCEGRQEAPILKYDRNGKRLASWGQGLFLFPHGATVDREGNLWVTDARGNGTIGHQVLKFSPEGRVLMTLGKKGVSASGADGFDQPTDVLVLANGDILVADSHRNGRNNRIVRFSKEGQYLREFGTKGSGPGQISEPHTIAIDSQGRLFVGDRENNRIQIFTLKEGKCKLTEEHFLPPGEHLISLGGGKSKVMSIYAGVTTPVRQCP